MSVIIVQQPGRSLTALATWFTSAAQAFYKWRLSPHKAFKLYVISLLFATAFVRLILWLGARAR